MVLSFSLSKSLRGGLIVTCLMLAGAVLPSTAAPVPLSSVLGSPVEGAWRTLQGTEVMIAPCDQAYCGSLSWIVIPKEFSALCEADKTAFSTKMMDAKNPDPVLKTRSILGMQMMTLQPTADPRTFTARIYSSEDGQTYDGLIWVINGDTTLRLGGGCVGPICAVTQEWPRVPPRETAPDFTCRPD